MNFLLGLSPPEKLATLALRGRQDLYFLIRYLLDRPDIEHPWLFARCREVQQDPDGYLDLWAREHYKSTIITFGLTIQDILNAPDLTVGIFSHTRPIAKGFLRQIKRELESNETLKDLYPEVLWENPQKQAPKWSEDDGIVVKRTGNPKESTVEAWGLVDGQPTSKHFLRMIYDDVVTRESVTTPDMIEKTTEALEVSYNLGADGGTRRFIGTRYHYNDTYRTIMGRGTAKPRIYPATESGEIGGDGILLGEETLAQKRRDMGPYTFGCQMMQNPKADETQGFKRDWIKHYGNVHGGNGMNKYLLVDAASSKKKGSDYTCMWVIGLGPDENYYALDIVRDRLSLPQRADRLIRLHKKWRPLQVRYEEYGLMADIEHIQTEQEKINYRFKIHKVAGRVAKTDRIKRLVPIFEQGRMWFPNSLNITDYEGVMRDLVHDFIEDEYAAFPVGLHDDMLDSLARIAEPDKDRNGKTIPNMALQWPDKDAVSTPRFQSYGVLDRVVGM